MVCGQFLSALCDQECTDHISHDHSQPTFIFDLRIVFSVEVSPLAPYATGWPSWSSE